LSETQLQKEIFKKGSKTYFNSSLFFPPHIRSEVSVLYAFVRVADDFVDSQPQEKESFMNFRETYNRIINGESIEHPIITPFYELMKKRNFDPQWVEAFLNSMEMDLYKSRYQTLEETLEYIYGSAEVIGLFMARIMDLPEEAHRAAQMLGRSMQYINFIRDIDEDNALGRLYLPLEDFSLTSLKPEEVKAKEKTFRNFHLRQIERYRKWQKEAEKGYKFIPNRYLIPIKTAADCYLWTARQIEKDPFKVFERKIKPSKIRIIGKMLANTLFIWKKNAA